MITTDYLEFLETKRLVAVAAGQDIDPTVINPILFPFQRDLVKWAIRKGRAAIFADTGLGKTFMQVEWARLIGEQTLIVAPLSIARQTVKEAAKLGVEVIYSRDGTAPGNITITNYEMIDKFDPAAIGAVVLDESSILKSLDGKTRRKLTDMFADVPYRLCCTATPAPNDISEIANHAEFLGIMSRVDMLASFFVHDSNTKNANGWRLKGHAEEGFYRWMASWGMSIRKPSDLDYDDDGYILPALNVIPHTVKSDYVPDGQLFFTGLHGIQDRASVRRATLEPKCEAAAALINDSSEQWIAWVGLNNESDLMAELVPDAIVIEGSQSPEEKAAGIEAFQDGQYRVLITKPSIAGFGMNFQNAHNMVFVGMNDSFEMYYQAVRRCYRFGQEYPVNVHIIIADAEEAILENVQSKEREALEMSQRLIENVQQYERAELEASDSDFEYTTDETRTPEFRAMLGDSVERMAEIDDESVHLSIFSPPFLSLYTYSATERDLGNSSKPDEFFEHFNFIIDELLRITVPGRNCAVHVAQVPATKLYDGYIGLKDFRGDVIRAFEARGWHYYGEVCIDKDPQAQAIRTKSKSLMFVTLDKDSTDLRPALADYILVFKKPGDNPIPVKPVENGEMSREDWIAWARPIWYGIKETETLNTAVAKHDKDERHICPLQLGTIERCVKLWSNAGETVFSPFMGIGSEGYEALKHGRRFVGIELNPNYYRVAVRNLKEAERKSRQVDLFMWAESQADSDPETEAEAEEVAR